MKTAMIAGILLAGAAVPSGAAAQDATTFRPISGTRLDVSANGTVSRVPDVALVTAGVQALKPTASAAIEDNAARMEKVRAALKRAGIADRDIQTASISLNPEYRYADNQPPVLTGYRASNSLSIRFRDLKRTGTILDALVAQGADQISGPSLTIDRPEAAQDEARQRAIVAGRARADLYAKALGMRVVRIISVSESGGYVAPPPAPMMMRAEAASAKTVVEPGSQEIQVNVAMSFELQ